MMKKMIIKKYLKDGLVDLQEAPQEIKPVRAEQLAILVEFVGERYILNDVPSKAAETAALLRNQYRFNEAVDSVRDLISHI